MGLFWNNNSDEKDFAILRERMVKDQIASRGLRDRRVLDAMLKVERHLFIPNSYREFAYRDQPVPIGYGQTISQPYIVAFMTEVLRLKGDEKVLEIGTGSGYQSAILSFLAATVYSIEIIHELAFEAAARLKRLGFLNVEVKAGDGYDGWTEHAPFNAIILTAAPERIPEPLIDQLAENGRLVAPVGRVFQDLVLMEKGKNGKISMRTITGVRFVPMTGKSEKNQ